MQFKNLYQFKELVKNKQNALRFTQTNEIRINIIQTNELSCFQKIQKTQNALAPVEIQ